jgi:hypothetical protein
MMRQSKRGTISLNNSTLFDATSTPMVVSPVRLAAGPGKARDGSPRLPLKPGNAGGGKGPQFKTDAPRGEELGDWATYQLHFDPEGFSIGRAHMILGLL